jgi:predicted PhzF superfamily epimerase YddE/YHI9
MRLPIYQVDAFTDSLFGGNPAAVCPLETWLPEKTMQAIAAENNPAETAFFVREGRDYALRWFTPTVEVDLCGHATLAAGQIVFRFIEPERDSVSFRTMNAGALVVSRRGEMLALDFRRGRPFRSTRRPACSRPWAVRRARCCVPATISWFMAAPRKSRRSIPILRRSPRWTAGPRS